MSERLLTARELAEQFGVSVETVLRWTRRGELPALRLPGGALRYRPEELELLLEEWRVGPEVADAAMRRHASNSSGHVRVRTVALITPPTQTGEEEEGDAT